MLFLDLITSSLSPAQGESSTDSPALSLQSKQLPSPSLSQPPSQKTSPQDNPTRSPLPTADPIITNGSGTKNSDSAKRPNPSSTSGPIPKKRKVDSSPEHLPSPVLENNVIIEERVKPIISPIRLASGNSSSGSGSSPRENGIPEQYRQDFAKHKSRSKPHRHRHHHHKQQQQPRGSSQPLQDRHHHHHRHQDRERERERGRSWEEVGYEERERGRSREEVGYEKRPRQEHSSKGRRTEYERYR